MSVHESPHSTSYEAPFHDITTQHEGFHDITTEHDYAHSIPSNSYNAEPTDAYDPFDDPLMYDYLDAYNAFNDYPENYDIYDNFDDPEIYSTPHVYGSDVTEPYLDDSTEFFDDGPHDIYDDSSHDIYDSPHDFYDSPHESYDDTSDIYDYDDTVTEYYKPYDEISSYDEHSFENLESVVQTTPFSEFKSNYEKYTTPVIERPQKQKPSYKPTKPSYKTPKPSYKTPKPSYKTPKPSYKTPKPSYKSTTPTYKPKQPSYEPDEPSYKPAKPSYKPSKKKPTRQPPWHKLKGRKPRPFPIKLPSLNKHKQKGSKFSVLDLLHDSLPLRKKKVHNHKHRGHSRPKHKSRSKSKAKANHHEEPVETYSTEIDVDEPMYYEDIQYHTPSPYAEHDVYAEDDEEEDFYYKESSEDDYTKDGDTYYKDSSEEYHSSEGDAYYEQTEDEYNNKEVYYKKPNDHIREYEEEEVYYKQPNDDIEDYEDEVVYYKKPEESLKEEVYYEKPDYPHYYKPKEFSRYQSEYTPSTTEIIPELTDVIKEVDWNVKDFTEWQENLVEPNYPYYGKPDYPPELVTRHQSSTPSVIVKKSNQSFAYEPTTPRFVSSSLPSDPPIPNPFSPVIRSSLAPAASYPSVSQSVEYREPKDYVAPEPFHISFDDWLNSAGVDLFGVPSSNILTYQAPGSYRAQESSMKDLPFLSNETPVRTDYRAPSTNDKIIGNVLQIIKIILII